MKRILIILIAGFLSACATTQSDSSPTGLTFVHLNDTYRVGAVEDGKAGGFGRVITVINELKGQGRDVRVLHGGDFLYPSLESSLWQGMQMVEAMNFIDDVAPLYVVAGNHEFDPRSPESLINAVKASRFDWLGSNYTFRTGDGVVDSALQPSITLTSGGKRIGIFSLSLHPNDGGTARDYLPMSSDYLAIAKATISSFEEAGVDAIVGLTHLHMWQDVQIAELRKEHPKFVFVVGGHDHEPEYRSITPQSAAVMKGASNARQIWTIDLEFDDAGMPSIKTKRLKLDESIATDAQYDVLAKKWRARLLEKFPFLEAQVGTAALPLDAREVAVRSGESNWGNFIADQMRLGFGKPHADLSFVNAGTLRIDDYIEDDIRFEDIGRTFDRMSEALQSISRRTS